MVAGLAGSSESLIDGDDEGEWRQSVDGDSQSMETWYTIRHIHFML